jgi:hypothetical protein
MQNRRETLKQNLAWLGMAGGKHLHGFRLMYSHKDLDLPINEVVDKMPAKQLNWALVQVQNSINELRKT